MRLDTKKAPKSSCLVQSQSSAFPAPTSLKCLAGVAIPTGCEWCHLTCEISPKHPIMRLCPHTYLITVCQHSLSTMPVCRRCRLCSKFCSEGLQCSKLKLPGYALACPVLACFQANVKYLFLAASSFISNTYLLTHHTSTVLLHVGCFWSASFSHKCFLVLFFRVFFLPSVPTDRPVWLDMSTG